jgi:hypothetical protein
VPERNRYRKPILEEFFSKKLNASLWHFNSKPLRMLVISTWRSICGIAYLSRQVVRQLEA